MASVNQVFMIGNLTRDPQIKYLPSQTPVCEFGIAMNRKWKAQDGTDHEEVTFVDVAAFGKLAEVVQQYCAKGKLVCIQGRLKQDVWEDKQGGGKRQKHSIIAEGVTFLGANPNTEGTGGDRGGYEQRQPETRQGQQGRQQYQQDRQQQQQPNRQPQQRQQPQRQQSNNGGGNRQPFGNGASESNGGSGFQPEQEYKEGDIPF